MKSRWPATVVLLLSFAFATGCASHPKSYSGIAGSAQMHKSEFSPQVMAYRNPNKDFDRYKKVILLPVEIYTGPDAEFKGVSAEKQQEMAGYLHDRVATVLAQRDLLTTTPGPDVACLKLVLVGLEKTQPVASTLTHVTPTGLALNLGAAATGNNGTFMGTASVGGEFTDVQTGELIASFVAKERADAMDVTVVVSPWDASKKAMDKMASAIGRLLEEKRVNQK